MDKAAFAALILKYLAAGALYGMYGWLVWMGKADSAGLVALLITGLSALGVHTISAPKA